MERFLELVEADERFDFTPENTDAVLTLRRLSSAETRGIKRRNTTTKTNKRTHQPYEETNYEAVGDDMLDAALVAWRGIKGDPPCTRENKMKLPGSVRSAILEELDRPAVASPDQEERKNS